MGGVPPLKVGHTYGVEYPQEILSDHGWRLKMASCNANSSSYLLQTFEIVSTATLCSMGGGTPHKTMLFLKFWQEKYINITKNAQNWATEISLEFFYINRPCWIQIFRSQSRFIRKNEVSRAPGGVYMGGTPPYVHGPIMHMQGFKTAWCSMGFW